MDRKVHENEKSSVGKKNIQWALGPADGQKREKRPERYLLLVTSIAREWSRWLEIQARKSITEGTNLFTRLLSQLVIGFLDGKNLMKLADGPSVKM